MTDLINFMESSETNLALIQEPPIKKNGSPYMIPPDYKAVYTATESKLTRSMILIRKNHHEFTIHPKANNNDLATIELSINPHIRISPHQFKAKTPDKNTSTNSTRSSSTTAKKPEYRNSLISTPIINNKTNNAQLTKAPPINAPSINAPLINALPISTSSINNPSINAPLIKDPSINAPSINTPSINTSLTNNQPKHTTSASNTLTNNFANKNQTIIISSIYLDGKTNIENNIKLLNEILEINNKNKLISGDFNAQSTIWGSPNTNERGKRITNYLADKPITSLVYRNTPTCFTIRDNQIIETVIDGTLATESLATKINNYQNRGQQISSDHATITFTLFLDRMTHQKKLRKKINYKKIDWTLFENNLSKHLELSNINYEQIKKIDQPRELDKTAEELTKAITNACTESTKKDQNFITKKTTINHPWWWRPELEHYNKRIRALKKSAKNSSLSKRLMQLDKITELQHEYVNKIHKAKQEIWEEHLKTRDENSIWKTINWLKKKNSSIPTQMLDTNGHIIAPENQAKAIAEAIFPTPKHHHKMTALHQTHKTPTERSQSLNPSIETQSTNEAINTHQSSNIPEITDAELSSIFKDIPISKSPGKDGINSLICQKVIELIPEIIKEIYQKSLDLSHIPKIWKHSLIIPIHKEKKGPATNPANYRPIGLLSILAKGLEKIISQRLIATLIRKKIINQNQHGFMPLKSTTTALRAIQKTIESNMKTKKFVSIIALDIKGAFDNLNWQTTLNTLSTFWEMKYVKWFVNYFKEREYEIITNQGSYSFKPEKGCVQGSPLSPILWNVVINHLLDESEKHNLKTIAYADDVTYLVSSDSISEYKSILENIETITQNWAKKVHLEFATEKTEIIHFKGKELHNLHLKMNNIPLNPKKHIKILGLWLDEKYNWEKHVQMTTEKANKITKIMRCLCLKGAGISQKMSLLIYTMIYKSIITYASEIWGKVCEKQKTKKQLLQSQKDILIAMTGAYRNTKLYDLLYITGQPLITIEILAKKKTYEAKETGKTDFFDLKDRDIEKKSFINENLPPEHYPKIEISTHPNESEYDLIIYTDGSVTPIGTGAAFVITKMNSIIKEKKLKLDDLCSIFQAESLAILEAIKFINTKYQNMKILIKTDSKSVTLSLENPKVNHELITEIKTNLITSQKQNIKTTFQWIKAHADNTGNEYADMLAKKATTSHQQPIYNVCPLSRLKLASKNWIREESTKEINEKISRNLRTLVGPNGCEIKGQPNKYLIWLLTGKGPFNYYLHKLGLANQKECECSTTPQDSIHLLTECEMIRHIRNITISDNYLNLNTIRKHLQSADSLDKLNKLAFRITKHLLKNRNVQHQT